MKCVHRDVRKAAQYRNLELRELVRVGDKLAGWKRQVVFEAMELGRGSKTSTESLKNRRKRGIKGVVMETGEKSVERLSQKAKRKNADR